MTSKRGQQQIDSPTESTGGIGRRSFFVKLAAAIGVAIPAQTALSASPPEDNRIDALEAQLADVKQQVGILEDTQAIRKLHHAYGYYIDKCLYEETVDLYADDSEVRFMGGIWKNKSGVRRLYVDTFQSFFTDGKNGPVPGFLLDHPQLQDIVDVAADRKTATARFRCLMQAGVHDGSDAPMAKSLRDRGLPPMQWWEGGIYENEYVRIDGIWRIKTLNYKPIWHADFDKGWAFTKPEYVPAYSETYPDNPNGPDELDAGFTGLWPNTDVVPFHYPHPVTGKPWS